MPEQPGHRRKADEIGEYAVLCEGVCGGGQIVNEMALNNFWQCLYGNVPSISSPGGTQCARGT
jgi:hypothetical protein